MKKTKLFFFNILIMTLTSFFLRSIHLSFTVYLSNTIGAEAMGFFHLILSVYFFAVTLATSGIGLSMTKLVAEELAFHNEEAIRCLITKAIGYCLFFSFLAAGLLIASAPFLTKFYFNNKITPLPLYILAIGLPFLSVSSALSGYFNAKRKGYKNALGQIPEQGLKMGVTIFLLSRFLNKNLTSICCALVLGGTVSEIFSCLYLAFQYHLEQRKAKKIKKFHIPSQNDSMKKILSLALPIAFSSYLRAGLSGFKQLSVPKRLNESGVSDAIERYGIINGMVMPILMFPSVVLCAFSSLVVPEITEKFVLGHRESLKRILTRIFKVTLLFAVASGGILFLYANELAIAVYHNTDVSFYLKILAPLVVIMYLDDIVDAVLKGINQQVAVVRINIIDSIVSISLLYFLLPVYHIKGYLMVIFIGEILNGSLSMIRLIRYTDFHFSLIRWIIVPAAVIWISMLAAKILIPFHMTASILLSVLLYAGILYTIGILNTEDFRL